jgi:hypothetical protein
MAKKSIYLTDDLQSRMAVLGDRLNWSEIAQSAFEKAMDDAHIEDFRDKVRGLIDHKLEDFWREQQTPMPPADWFKQVDAVHLMAEQACNWIADQISRIGITLVEKEGN